MHTIAELKRIVEEVRHELIGRTEEIYELYDSETEKTQDKLRSTKSGRVLGYRNRRSDLSRYVSTCCKSEIVFIENEEE